MECSGRAAAAAFAMTTDPRSAIAPMRRAEPTRRAVSGPGEARADALSAAWRYRSRSAPLFGGLGRNTRRMGRREGGGNGARGESFAAPMGKWPLRTNMRFGRRPNASKKQQGRSGLAGYAHVLPEAKREAANRLATMLA